MRKLFEGVYALREWHAGQEILKPPAVEGRFALTHGVVLTILKNWAQASRKVAVASWGSYVFDESGFSYRYDDSTVVTETPGEKQVSYGPLFEGIRTFTVTHDSDGLHFRRVEGGIEFLFTADGLKYSENGKVLRFWQRVKAPGDS